MRTLVACCPILWLLLSLSLLHCKAWKATLFALILAVLCTMFGFPEFPLQDIPRCVVSGLSLAIYPICLVILAALFTHAVVVESGAMKIIRTGLAQISDDRRILALLIVWGFGNFMEGIAGFGTSVAIPASILVGIGFTPIKAVVMCLVANTAPAAFGSVGIPVFTMAKVAGIDLQILTTHTVLMQCAIIATTPFLVLWILDGRHALRGFIGITLLIDAAFLVPWVLLGHVWGSELPNLIGALSVMTFIIAKSPQVRNLDLRVQTRAWLPFALVVFFLVAATFLPADVKHFVPSAGLIFLGALLGGLLQGLTLVHLIQVLLRTFWRLRTSFATILAVLAMASVMEHSGMISTLATATIKVTGNTYPFFAPIIGALGSFVTGSVTSSNILFGAMQANIAMDMAVSPFSLTASSVMGACIGKMICPQSVAIGAAAVALAGQEGDIMKKSLPWFAGVLLVSCLVSALFASFLPLL